MNETAGKVSRNINMRPGSRYNMLRSNTTGIYFRNIKLQGHWPLEGTIFKIIADLYTSRFNFINPILLSIPISKSAVFCKFYAAVAIYVSRTVVLLKEIFWLLNYHDINLQIFSPLNLHIPWKLFTALWHKI